MADAIRNNKWRTKNQFKGKKRRTYTLKKHTNVKKTKVEIIPAANGNDEAKNPADDLLLPIANELETMHENLLDNTANEVEGFISASQQKIAAFSVDFKDFKVSDASNCIIVQISAISSLLSVAACKHCGASQLKVLEKSNRKGLVSTLTLLCQNPQCPNFNICQNQVYTSTKVGTNNDSNSFCVGREGGGGSSKLPFSANVKAVLASRAVGIGHNQLNRFCAIMGLPKPLHHKSFVSLSKKLYVATKLALAKNMTEVRQKVIEKNNNSKVACMFDGTWQKRGHKSHNGVGILIEIETGYCIDHEVLSNYCKVCSNGPKETDNIYEAWKINHIPNCQKNIDCTSNAMEKEAALRIWQRSEKLDPPLCYTTFLSDGDSKAFQAVSESKIYGERADVVKEDCTNHVAKRLGTALRKLKMPRGHTLNDGTIKRLQLYYTVAITNNRGNVIEMYKAIWASYFHSTSTNEQQAHKFCPPGEDSWCKWKVALARQDPMPEHTPRISRPQAEEMLPIYKRLTEADLLQRCSKGKTQNAAESLNSKIWTLCPKSRYATKTAVETATGLAILWFNKGSAGFSDVLQELQITPSKNYCIQAEKADQFRISTMKRRMTGEYKGRRKHKRLADAKENDRLAAEEGETYAAGGF